MSDKETAEELNRRGIKARPEGTPRRSGRMYRSPPCIQLLPNVAGGARRRSERSRRFSAHKERAGHLHGERAAAAPAAAPIGQLAWADAGLHRVARAADRGAADRR